MLTLVRSARVVNSLNKSLKTMRIALGVTIALGSLMPGTLSYRDGDQIPVWANRFSPLHNPQETFSVEDLPICELWAETVTRRDISFGELISGHAPVLFSRLHVGFKVDSESRELCNMRLRPENAQELGSAIRAKYLVEYSMDGLPASVPLGAISKDGTPLLYTHKDVVCTSKDDKVISFSITPRSLVPLDTNDTIKFTYSLKWTEAVDAASRTRVLRPATRHTENEILTYATCNGMMMVALLAGTVIHLLNKAASSEVDVEGQEESGWKQVQGDAFRKPSQLPLLSAIVAAGVQLSCTVTTSIVIAEATGMQSHQFLDTLVWTYCGFQTVAGFVGSYYLRMFQTKSVSQAYLLQWVVFPLFLFCVLVYFNTISFAYGTTGTVTLSFLLTGVGLLVVANLPLHLLGARVGLMLFKSMTPPARVTSLSRPLPDNSHFLTAAGLVLPGLVSVGGSAVHWTYFFGELWSSSSFGQWQEILIGFILLLTLHGLAAVVAVFVMLNSEDHRWPR